MNKTREQIVKDNLLELERLRAIYVKIDEYAKQLSGVSIFELQSLIEEADRFDNAFNMDNWVDGQDPCDIYYE